MRLLHVMLRVRNSGKTLDFYCNIFEMKLIERRKTAPAGKFALASVGYGSEEKDTVLEFTLDNWETDDYELGVQLGGHIAINVDDILQLAKPIRCKRRKYLPENSRPMKHGTTLLAFVEDPDGQQNRVTTRTVTLALESIFIIKIMQFHQARLS